jgi:uncharacterized protein (DUF1800 family)
VKLLVNLVMVYTFLNPLEGRFLLGGTSDVNVHETNSFFKANFQFVSISKRNVVFYSYIALSESKIRPISFKNFKEILKPKQNEFSSQSKKTNYFRY